MNKVLVVCHSKFELQDFQNDEIFNDIQSMVEKLFNNILTLEDFDTFAQLRLKNKDERNVANLKIVLFYAISIPSKKTMNDSLIFEKDNNSLYVISTVAKENNGLRYHICEIKKEINIPYK